MSVIYPPADFTEESYNQSQQSGLPLKAAPPLLLDEKTNVLTVAAANAASSGVVSTTAQTFAGAKTFASVPITTGGPPTAGNELATKGYVDSLYSAGISWVQEINLGFLAAPPGVPVNGDRFISTATAGGFTIHRIYTYDSGVPGWVETIPLEGYALYNQSNTAPFANSCVIFTDAGVWAGLASALQHANLSDVPAGSISHATINSYLNQAVQTGSDVVFRTVKGQENDYLPATTPLTNQWYRLMPAVAVVNFDIEFSHRPYGWSRVAYYAYSPGPSSALHIFTSQIGVFHPRAAMYRVISSGLYHLYIAARNYSLAITRVCAAGYVGPITFTDCGPTSAPPNDLPVGDYTLIRDSDTDATAYPSLYTGNILACNGGSAQVILKYDPAGVNATTLQTDAGGDLVINSTGNDISVHATDTFRVLNTAESSSTTSGGLQAIGGAGIAKTLCAGAIRAPARPFAGPSTTAIWYRIAPPSASYQAVVSAVGITTGRVRMQYYAVSGTALLYKTVLDRSVPAFDFRAAIYREITSGLYHCYLVALSTSACGLEFEFPSGYTAPDWVPELVACGSTAADPNDLPPADYTLEKATQTTANLLGGAEVGLLRAENTSDQLTLAYSPAVSSTIGTDLNGYLNLNAGGGRVQIDSGDSLRVLSTTASTSSITGAEVISGGLGVAGDIWCAGVIHGVFNGNVPSPLTITSTTTPQLTVAYSPGVQTDFTTTSGGGLVISPTATTIRLNGNITIGNGTSSDYRYIALAGGNSWGYTYGSFPGLGDGHHSGYNFFVGPTGIPVIPNSGGSTSRITSAYGYVEFCTGVVNTPPTTKMFITTTDISCALKTTITDTVQPQLRVAYDGTNFASLGTDSGGNFSIGATNWTSWSSTGTMSSSVFSVANIPVRARRMGSLVIIELDTFQALATNAANEPLVFSTTIPSLYRPNTYITSGFAAVYDNDGVYPGSLQIDSAGTVQLLSHKTKDTTFGFGNGKAAGLTRVCSITFTV